jgi:predicted Zn finger-like uncharacterized protein
MILTCPNCSARFMVDGHALGPGGRTVRCGACGHSWLQLPEPAAADQEAGFESQPPPALAVPQAGAADAARPHEPAPPVVEQESGRKRGRRRAEAALAEAAEAPPRRRGVSRVLIWFVFVFIVAAIVLGGYRYRNDIVQIWPPASRLYQVLGLRIDTGWLSVPPESIRFRRESEGGIPILVVSGEILNPTDKPQRVAPMRIILLDKENVPLRTERVKIDDRTLDPGKRMPFKTSIPNPPPEAASVRITFDPG